MPELPEVETVRRSLLPLVGIRIDCATVYETRLRRPIPDDLATQTNGCLFVDFERRAKYLLCRLSSGATLLVHLGMSGTFFVRDALPQRARHDHVIFRLADGRELVFNDPRRFGILRIVDDEPIVELQSVGIDPLSAEFNADFLWAVTRKRQKPIKNLIMDQTLIAGVGNIYASEALFRAGIRPRRQARRLRRAEAEQLCASIRNVLDEAIQLGGSSISDYRDGRGRPGYFQLRLRVYDRAGEPCPTCDTAVTRIVQSGRSSFYCRSCQR